MCSGLYYAHIIRFPPFFLSFAIKKRSNIFCVSWKVNHKRKNHLRWHRLHWRFSTIFYNSFKYILFSVFVLLFQLKKLNISLARFHFVFSSVLRRLEFIVFSIYCINYMSLARISFFFVAQRESSCDPQCRDA